MASSPPTSQGANLLLTLPPELRNVIYALVINTDFYELDPTISAKTFPRPRYGIFRIRRGIKAQGGTPAIAKTCRGIRSEALDVYYGSNTFSLVGDESTQRKQPSALTNRTAALEWMRLIGNDAKYLRKVRILLHHGGLSLDSHLMSVVPDESGKAPLVMVTSDPQAFLGGINVSAMRARTLQTAIQDHLKETNDMGRVWRAVSERAMYPFFGKIEDFNYDISEQGIARIAARYPINKPKAAAKTSASSYACSASLSKTNALAATETPGYDLNCIETKASSKKINGVTDEMEVEVSNALPTRKVRGGQEEDYDVMEVEASSNNPQAARKEARKATPTTKATDGSGMSTPKFAPATRAVSAHQKEAAKDIAVGEPAQSTKAAKAGATKMVYGAAPLTTATH